MGGKNWFGPVKIENYYKKKSQNHADISGFLQFGKKNSCCYNVVALNFHAKNHYDGCDHFSTISNTVIYKKLRSRDPEYPLKVR